MKNQMMNLFASYSFYYFPGYYYCADCFCCKKQPSPTEGLSILRKRKRKCGAGVCDCSRHRLFCFRIPSNVCMKQFLFSGYGTSRIQEYPFSRAFL